VVNEHGVVADVRGERLVYDNKWVKVGLTDVEAPSA
jgi:hypothetical protein